MSDFIVSDLTVDHTFLHLWDEVLEIAEASNDKLRGNYIGLDPASFLSLPVVIHENKIVTFSGLQYMPDRWGPKIGRCNSRFWRRPDFRWKGGLKLTKGEKFLNTLYSLPLQIQKAKEAKLDCLFISREDYRKAFQMYLNLVKENTDKEFLLEDQQYNVCGHQDPIPPSCVQHVAILHLSARGPKVWKKFMEPFKIHD